MQFSRTFIEGVWVITPLPHIDQRGYFMRTWCNQEFAKQGIKFVPVQSNSSLSIKKGTIRGLHFQKQPTIEAKLVKCIAGSIFDVAVDLRANSQTYCRWFGIELTSKNNQMLFVPEMCAHGYQTLEDNTEVAYMTSGHYEPKCVSGVRFNDPLFSIKWPLQASSISEQDKNWQDYKET